MSDIIAKIEIEQGKDHLPTLMKVRFSPQTWNFAFYISRMAPYSLGMSDESYRKEEIRNATFAMINMIEKQVKAAVKEELGVDL